MFSSSSRMMLMVIAIISVIQLLFIQYCNATTREYVLIMRFSSLPCEMDKLRDFSSIPLDTCFPQEQPLSRSFKYTIIVSNGTQIPVLHQYADNNCTWQSSELVDNNNYSNINIGTCIRSNWGCHNAEIITEAQHLAISPFGNRYCYEKYAAPCNNGVPYSKTCVSRASGPYFFDRAINEWIFWTEPRDNGVILGHGPLLTVYMDTNTSHLLSEKCDKSRETAAVAFPNPNNPMLIYNAMPYTPLSITVGSYDVRPLFIRLHSFWSNWNSEIVAGMVVNLTYQFPDKQPVSMLCPYFKGCDIVSTDIVKSTNLSFKIYLQNYKGLGPLEPVFSQDFTNLPLDFFVNPSRTPNLASDSSIDCRDGVKSLTVSHFKRDVVQMWTTADTRVDIFKIDCIVQDQDDVDAAQRPFLDLYKPCNSESLLGCKSLSSSSRYPMECSAYGFIECNAAYQVKCRVGNSVCEYKHGSLIMPTGAGTNDTRSSKLSLVEPSSSSSSSSSDTDTHDSNSSSDNSNTTTATTTTTGVPSTQPVEQSDSPSTSSSLSSSSSSFTLIIIAIDLTYLYLERNNNNNHNNKSIIYVIQLLFLLTYCNATTREYVLIMSFSTSSCTVANVRDFSSIPLDTCFPQEQHLSNSFKYTITKLRDGYRILTLNQYADNNCTWRSSEFIDLDIGRCVQPNLTFFYDVEIITEAQHLAITPFGERYCFEKYTAPCKIGVPYSKTCKFGPSNQTNIFDRAVNEYLSWTERRSNGIILGHGFTSSSLGGITDANPFHLITDKCNKSRETVAADFPLTNPMFVFNAMFYTPLSISVGGYDVRPLFIRLHSFSSNWHPETAAGMVVNLTYQFPDKQPVSMLCPYFKGCDIVSTDIAKSTTLSFKIYLQNYKGLGPLEPVFSKDFNYVPLGFFVNPSRTPNLASDSSIDCRDGVKSLTVSHFDRPFVQMWQTADTRIDIFKIDCIVQDQDDVDDEQTPFLDPDNVIDYIPCNSESFLGCKRLSLSSKYPMECSAYGFIECNASYQVKCRVGNSVCEYKHGSLIMPTGASTNETRSSKLSLVGPSSSDTDTHSSDSNSSSDNSNTTTATTTTTGVPSTQPVEQSDSPSTSSSISSSSSSFTLIIIAMLVIFLPIS
ncbi:hypothetical protein DFA_07774 [Cavenderia fasciculata]|uniref:Uncharacterized protein n=1 Tax=Cavenderia fasciculata TaxID=261658 RepID=F4Q374_CACFS|nr:uncharacterized protein DFA_07774 [Cavenderia fasciculata]EGG16796.1 hypothetical protein DFA_07774 [Cavenderia fasciculata]|eukprot:XP_004355270.1 hypothetical protein DFA_07774 [Cavenderia fasciculata]